MGRGSHGSRGVHDARRARRGRRERRPKMSRTATTLMRAAALVAFVLAIATAIVWVRARRVPADDRTESVLHVPRSPSAIVIDGETSDRGWLDPPGPAR